MVKTRKQVFLVEVTTRVTMETEYHGPCRWRDRAEDIKNGLRDDDEVKSVKVSRPKRSESKGGKTDES